MTYILESTEEADRLNRQSKLSAFNIESELEGISIPKNGTVLDAGCGSGVLTQFLDQTQPELNIHGCDISDERINYCTALNPNINYFKKDLLNESLSPKYDVIFNRYVAHHFKKEQYAKMLKNLKSGLKSHGKLIIIDADRIALNIGTSNKELLGYLDSFRQGFPGNLEMARLIPEMLNRCGYSDIKYEIKVMDFQEEERIGEVQQWTERISQSMKMYIEIFESEFVARRYFKLFIDEISNPLVPIYYNKFIISAFKSNDII